MMSSSDHCEWYLYYRIFLPQQQPKSLPPFAFVVPLHNQIRASLEKDVDNLLTSQS